MTKYQKLLLKILNDEYEGNQSLMAKRLQKHSPNKIINHDLVRNNIYRPQREVSPLLAKLVELETNGKYKRTELNPETVLA